jgi:AraC-like DNA-binding protein
MLIQRCELPRRRGRSMPPHRHQADEWHFAMAGACAFDIGDRSVEFSPGDLLLIPAGVEHRLRIRREGEWLRQVVVATCHQGPEDEALMAAFLARTGEGRVLPAGCQGHAFFAALAQDLASRDPFRQRAASLRFTALLCELVARAAPQGHPAVAGALELMRLHLVRPLSLDEIAKAAGCSRSTIARRFREEIGEPPLAYHLGLRLDFAAEQLRGRRGRRISEIAAAAGFPVPYHFSRCFSRRFGRPPSAWC